MAQIIDGLQAQLALYPRWLVVTCLCVVGLGVAWASWKALRFGMVLVVTSLLLAIIGFAGWMILAS